MAGLGAFAGVVVAVVLSGCQDLEEDDQMSSVHSMNSSQERFLDGPCICPSNYYPVCGVDGKTYNNECLAACAGVEEHTEGCCCTELHDPVCGNNEETYDNPCLADCAQVDYTEGECQEPCICPSNYYPVCGVDGKTYNNECLAACAGVEEHTEGCCCTELHDPVCGNNEETYNNPCLAECAGVEFTEGECLEHPLPECVVDMYTGSEFTGNRHILTVTQECVGGSSKPFDLYDREACIYDTTEFPHNLAHDMHSVKTSGLCERTILVDGDGCQNDHPEHVVLHEVDSESGKNLPLDFQGNVCKIVVILPVLEQR